MTATNGCQDLSLAMHLRLCYMDDLTTTKTSIFFVAVLKGKQGICRIFTYVAKTHKYLRNGH